ncbi:hypothetical protein BDV38DRAFT_43116 [Aspergillus pseudotamarii]|uniref:Uncharacterized protein n=1 Tax=Aspergillus pseudotamarii TaxID=132259 RepID=A0A5N6SBN7_ASPPS|nr:uncharacterized protein BDV38DRAFT_43116 [Aspergillus pseudotamarii]KAE8130813.1 hypothetical protein BDV38DRAFT_43116 [Aspergillus pseudotamarii]
MKPDNLTLGHSESAAPTSLTGGSPSYGEMAVQRSTHCECTPTVSSFVEDPESAVQNTRLGRATESGGKVASDGEHIHGRSNCNDSMAFPSAKQNSNWAPETGTLFDCSGSMPCSHQAAKSILRRASLHTGQLKRVTWSFFVSKWSGIPTPN